MREGGLKKEKLAGSGRFLNPILRPILFFSARVNWWAGLRTHPLPPSLKNSGRGELCQSGRELIKKMAFNT